MSTKTKIPWADLTINPWVGCTKCRAGCTNCYAERLAYRLAAMGQENYKTVLRKKDGWDGRNWNGKIAYQMEQLEKLKHWHKPRRVFIGSMTDIFHETVPFREIVWVFDAMYESTQHTYIIATKRPDKALAFAQWWDARWSDHIHLVISCSTQKDLDEMAPVLLQIPAAVRGVSLEPLLEEIDLRKYLTGKLGLAHVIVGCESGPKRRPCDIEWVRSIVRQCKDAGVAVYLKQLNIGGKVVTDPVKFPSELRWREYPK